MLLLFFRYSNSNFYKALLRFNTACASMIQFYCKALLIEKYTIKNEARIWRLELSLRGLTRKPLVISSIVHLYIPFDGKYCSTTAPLVLSFSSTHLLSLIHRSIHNLKLLHRNDEKMVIKFRHFTDVTCKFSQATRLERKKASKSQTNIPTDCFCDITYTLYQRCTETQVFQQTFGKDKK